VRVWKLVTGDVWIKMVTCDLTTSMPLGHIPGLYHCTPPEAVGWQAVKASSSGKSLNTEVSVPDGEATIYHCVAQEAGGV
jgi:hypothetical protein